MTSDHAPAAKQDSDYSGARIWGVDHLGDLYLLDGFREQVTMDALADRVIGNKDKKQVGLITKHRPICWFPEDDNNWKSSAGFITRMMREQQTFCRVEPISPHGSDKPTKAQPFQGMASMGRVWIPEGPEGDDVIDQYLKFPAGTHDDEVDMASLIGRAIADAHPAVIPPQEQKRHVDRWDAAFNKDDEGEESWKTS
jgi:predicted phage terminase large subunit-like protein